MEEADWEANKAWFSQPPEIKIVANKTYVLTTLWEHPVWPLTCHQQWGPHPMNLDLLEYYQLRQQHLLGGKRENKVDDIETIWQNTRVYLRKDTEIMSFFVYNVTTQVRWLEESTQDKYNQGPKLLAPGTETWVPLHSPYGCKLWLSSL